MFEEVDARGPPRGGGASTREPWKVARAGERTTAIVWLAAQQIDEHVHGGTEGSNVAECDDALAQCLPGISPSSCTCRNCGAPSQSSVRCVDRPLSEA